MAVFQPPGDRCYSLPGSGGVQGTQSRGGGSRGLIMQLTAGGRYGLVLGTNC